MPPPPCSQVPPRAASQGSIAGARPAGRPRPRGRKGPPCAPTLHSLSPGAVSPPGGISATAAGSRPGRAALEAAGSVRAALALHSAATPKTKTTRARTAPRQGGDSGRVTPPGPQPRARPHAEHPRSGSPRPPTPSIGGHGGSRGVTPGGGALQHHPALPTPLTLCGLPVNPTRVTPERLHLLPPARPDPTAGSGGCHPPGGCVLPPPPVTPLGIRSAAPLLPPTEQQQHRRPRGSPSIPTDPPQTPTAVVPRTPGALPADPHGGEGGGGGRLRPP